MDIESTNQMVNEGTKSGLSKDSFVTQVLLGKGSYAKVVLVKKKDDGKLYALKILKKSSIKRPRHKSNVNTERYILVS